MDFPWDNYSTVRTWTSFHCKRKFIPEISPLLGRIHCEKMDYCPLWEVHLDWKSASGPFGTTKIQSACFFVYSNILMEIDCVGPWYSTQKIMPSNDSILWHCRLHIAVYMSQSALFFFVGLLHCGVVGGAFWIFWGVLLKIDRLEPWYIDLQSQALHEYCLILQRSLILTLVSTLHETSLLPCIIFVICHRSLWSNLTIKFFKFQCKYVHFISNKAVVCFILSRKNPTPITVCRYLYLCFLVHSNMFNFDLV